MKRRVANIAILFSLVGLPVGVALGIECLGDWVGLPVLTTAAAPAMIALALEQQHHQKA